ncbi:MAG TPA: MBL fold metallo-hydrolase [Thermoanaerobacterales bacterium]|jgi:hydroxyacylglutathione hydrolase|nr:MBL fold metallo-hydrolase [Thermoanaerobacterales bacterium]
MYLNCMQVGPLLANCYIIGDYNNKKAAVIDPGGNPEDILNALKEEDFELEYIILTHGHQDHIGGLPKIKEVTGAPIAIHEKDASMLVSPRDNLSAYMGKELTYPSADIELKDGQELKVGDLILTIIHTPGHTPGGICIKVNDIVFTGDTLFAGSVGRTDFPGGSFDQLIESITSKLLPLGDKITIYPGHGGYSTIEQEKSSNPFLYY